MTKEKVTIQDIADALGISRNTASKALNGESIPDETREGYQKAIELKYKQFAFMETDNLLTKTRETSLFLRRIFRAPPILARA